MRRARTGSAAGRTRAGARAGTGAGASGLGPSAFCRRNQLQKPLRVLEHGLQSLRIRSQRTGGELCCQTRIAKGRVLGDKPHFIHPDRPFVSSQNGL